MKESQYRPHKGDVLEFKERPLGITTENKSVAIPTNKLKIMQILHDTGEVLAHAAEPEPGVNLVILKYTVEHLKQLLENGDLSVTKSPQQFDAAAFLKNLDDEGSAYNNQRLMIDSYTEMLMRAQEKNEKNQYEENEIIYSVESAHGNWGKFNKNWRHFNNGSGNGLLFTKQIPKAKIIRWLPIIGGPKREMSFVVSIGSTDPHTSLPDDVPSCLLVFDDASDVVDTLKYGETEDVGIKPSRIIFPHRCSAEDVAQITRFADIYIKAKRNSGA